MIPVRVLSLSHTAVANLKSNLFHIGRNEMHELFSIYQAEVSREADEKGRSACGEDESSPWWWYAVQCSVIV